MALMWADKKCPKSSTKRRIPILSSPNLRSFSPSCNTSGRTSSLQHHASRPQLRMEGWWCWRRAVLDVRTMERLLWDTNPVVILRSPRCSSNSLYCCSFIRPLIKRPQQRQTCKRDEGICMEDPHYRSDTFEPAIWLLTMLTWILSARILCLSRANRPRSVSRDQSYCRQFLKE